MCPCCPISPTGVEEALRIQAALDADAAPKTAPETYTGRQAVYTSHVGRKAVVQIVSEPDDEGKVTIRAKSGRTAKRALVDLDLTPEAVAHEASAKTPPRIQMNPSRYMETPRPEIAREVLAYDRKDMALADSLSGYLQGDTILRDQYESLQARGYIDAAGNLTPRGLDVGHQLLQVYRSPKDHPTKKIPAGRNRKNWVARLEAAAEAPELAPEPAPEPAFAHAKHVVGDSVRFDWPGETGWESHTGVVVGVRKHPRPKMSLRTTAPLQYQVKREKGRAVWVDDTQIGAMAVVAPAPAEAPAPVAAPAPEAPAPDKALAEEAHAAATAYARHLEAEGLPQSGRPARAIANLRSMATKLQSGKANAGHRREARRAIDAAMRLIEPAPEPAPAPKLSLMERMSSFVASLAVSNPAPVPVTSEVMDYVRSATNGKFLRTLVSTLKTRLAKYPETTKPEAVKAPEVEEVEEGEEEVDTSVPDAPDASEEAEPEPRERKTREPRERKFTLTQLLRLAERRLKAMETSRRKAIAPFAVSEWDALTPSERAFVTLANSVSGVRERLQAAVKRGATDEELSAILDPVKRTTATKMDFAADSSFEFAGTVESREYIDCLLYTSDAADE